MKKNQKGFTLVELIIAVAILAIVTLAVCGFIVVGSRSYTTANTDIMLQQDAQLALNQISDVIIDTTDSISYGLRSGGSGDMQLVLKDSEFAGEADEKCLVVVNKQEAGSVNDNKSYWFYWSKDDEMIYFNEVDASSDMDEGDIKSAFEDAAKQENVSILAQHVKDFSVDISQFEANRVVMISVLFANGNREYATSNNVTVRNRIAINQITVDPMRRATEFTITVVPSLTLEPGDFYELSDVINVGGDAEDKALSFEIVGGVLNDTSVTSTGYLTVGKAETRSNFSVKVSRANEEYAGQNERVAKTIRINVKRATTVNIGGPDTAKQGETIELTNSRAAGNLLGVRCDANLCVSDDLSKDEDLHNYISTGDNFGWKIISGGEYAQLSNPTSSSASVKIDQNAPEGSKIVIQASSLLSGTKGYGNTDTPTVPPVTGTKTITIEKGANGYPSIGGDLKFGTDNDPGIFDSIRSNLPTDHGRYVFCVRIREKGTSGCANDWYMLYFTQGANLRFSPDAFGLDLTKSYEVYMQAIFPATKNAGGQWVEDSKEEIWAEYSTHLNADGKYVGTRYLYDEYYQGQLNPPSVQITCDNVVYPNADPNYTEVFNLLNDSGKRSLGKINIYSEGVINVQFNAVDGKLRSVVYKEDEEGRWKRAYGYEYDQTQYVSIPSQSLERIALPESLIKYENNTVVFQESGNPYNGQNKFGPVELQPKDDPSVKVDPNGTKSEGCGSYHIVTGFIFANNPCIRAGAYDDSQGNLIAERINGDFKPYFYKQWDSVINLDVTMGLNLRFVPDDTKANNNDGYERWTSFPLPTDADFPFALKNSEKQTITRYVPVYSATGTKLEQPHELSDYYLNLVRSSATVTCEYIQGINGSKDSYNITIALEAINGKNVTTTSYGTYKCEVGGKEWVYQVGTAWQKTDTISTNLEFTKQYETYSANYEAYFPAPGESGFPFAGTSGAQTKTYRMLVYQKGNDYSGKYETYTMTWNGTTLTINAEEIQGHKKITYYCGEFTYNSSTKKWNKASGVPSHEKEPYWSCPATITYNGVQYKIDIPMPGDANFPNMVNNQGSVEFYGQYGYDPDDEFGEKNATWIAIKINYTDKGNGTYAVVVSNAYNSNEKKDFTCSKSNGQWVAKE